MKKLSSLAVLAACGISSIFAEGRADAAVTYTQTVESTPGLMAYYQFSGDTNSSVHGYTGTLTTGASIGGVNTGPSIADDSTNRALVLNGTSGNELLSSLSSGVATSGSVVGFFNLAELPSVAGRYFYVAGESANGDDYDIQVQNDNNLYFYTDSGGNVNAPLPANAVGNYVFFAATFTANHDRNLYINGQLVASNTPGGHGDSGNPFTIGYSNVFGNRAFDGNIDEVAFYNTDLSATQVSAIYNSIGVVPEPASLSFIGVASAGLLSRRRRRLA